MDDVSDVGFVYPHPEGDGGYDGADLFLDKRLLTPLSVIVGHPCVVRRNLIAAGGELSSHLVYVSAADAVDDAGLLAVTVQRLTHLFEPVDATPNPVKEIRPIEPADQYRGIV
jgi:hypothetical protein